MQLNLALTPPSNKPVPLFRTHQFEKMIATNGMGQLWLSFKEGRVQYKVWTERKEEFYEDYDYALAILSDLGK